MEEGHGDRWKGVMEIGGRGSWRLVEEGHGDRWKRVMEIGGRGSWRLVGGSVCMYVCSVSRGTLPVRINIWVSVSAAVRVFWESWWSSRYWVFCFVCLFVLCCCSSSSFA